MSIHQPKTNLNIEGREYNILVKGDASSGSSLLGTSIQTALLYTRLQTPRSSEYPQGLSSEIKFLKKTFGFTDQLDSLNRWFSDFTDADRNKKLSKYRDENLISENEIPIHEHAGQIWPISKKLGYDLSQSLRTTRCSSQDPGADNNSDFIIATASLEVGFDDPDVGVVIHHKAPKNISSFIQRKGRAGRTRGSRPTTITVLSDYGRDRWYYQNSDKLFFPQINRINLPMLNPYILKVQATTYLIDWIGNQIRVECHLDIYVITQMQISIMA